MAERFRSFADLGENFCKDTVIVRLLNFWESRNFLKGNVLNGFELLLIDATATTIQAFIPVSRLPRYEEDLQRNAIYKLQRFLVNSPKTLYRVSDHKYGVTFTNHTMFKKLDEESHKIEEQLFRLRNYSDFAAIVDRHIDLYDVIGCITVITGNHLNGDTPNCSMPTSNNAQSKDKVFLHLLMKDGQSMRVYLWDTIASDFRTKWNARATKPTVVLLTTVNPKTFGGAVTLSSTPATRIFFDDDLSETKEYLASLGDAGKLAAALDSSTSAITKLETVTLNEIHSFLQNENPQKASFICVATVGDVLEENGWNYVSCTGCKKKVTKTETSLFCPRCKETNTVGLLRYRYEVAVRDENGVATFVLLDDVASKIAARSAPDAFHEMKEEGVEHPHSTVPECLFDIVGRTCKFQVSVSEYNFTATRQTITVARILEYDFKAEVENNGGNSKEEDTTPTVALENSRPPSASPSLTTGDKDQMARDETEIKSGDLRKVGLVRGDPETSSLSDSTTQESKRARRNN